MVCLDRIAGWFGYYRPRWAGLLAVLAARERAEQAAAQAQLDLEVSETTKQLARDLCLTSRDVPIIALRMLAKCLRDDSVCRDDVAALREVRR